MEIQKLLFEEIKNKLPLNTRLADAVSEVLNISIDAAYRRIRLEKELSLTETVELCRRFDILLRFLSNAKQSSGNVQFRYTSLNSTNFESFYNYKNALATSFESIAQGEGRGAAYLQERPIYWYFILRFLRNCLSSKILRGIRM